MSTYDIFVWLEKAPSGMWALAFCFFVGSLFSLGYFFYRQVNKILQSGTKLHKIVTDSTTQLNTKLEHLERDMRTMFAQHDQEINSAIREIGQIRGEIGHLKGEMVSLVMLKRIELFLEKLTAQGINPSSAIVEAFKFERATREDNDRANSRSDN